MANDFSLDPYQVEEENLAEQYKRALAKSLRPTPAMDDPSARFYSAYDKATADRDIGDIQNKRTQLGQRFQSSLVEALRDQPENVRALAMNPATREQGLSLMKAQAEMDMREREMDKIRARRNGPMGQSSSEGGSLPQAQFAASYQEAMDMAEHPDKRISDIGKLRLEQMKLGPASNSVRTLPSGQTMTDPMAQSAAFEQNLAKEIAANPEGMKMPDGSGGTKLIPWTVVLQQMGRTSPPGSPAPSPRALPSATGAASTPNGPATGPIPPASAGPTGRPPPVFNLSGKLSPEEAMAIARDRDKLGPGAQMPSGPVGTTPSPMRVKGFEKQVDSNVAAMQKMEETQADFGAVISKLGYIRNLNKNPSYQGFGATVGPVLEESVGALGGGTSAKYANTKAMEAAIQDLVGPILHQYGYNPSNRDLIQAQLRLPSMGSSAEARDAVASLVMKGMAAEQEVGQMTRDIFDQNEGRVSPQQAKQFAWKMFNDKRDAEEAKQKSGNPTSAADGQKGPLAATVRAEYDKTKKQLAGENSLGSALWEKAKSLPGAIFSGAGAEGMVDAYGNMIEGGKELFGQGDREKAMAELRRQEERSKTDPDYEQAKIFHSVFNPVSVAGGAATTLPKAIGAGMAMGALHPADSAGSQAWSTAVGGGLAGAGTLASRLLPSTRAAPALEEAGLSPSKAAGPVKGTSAQLNPELGGSKIAAAVGANDSAALRQSKELTQALMAEGKIAGDRLTREGVDAAKEAANTAQRETLAAQPIKLPKPELKSLVESVSDLINTNGANAFVKDSPLMEFMRKATAQSTAKGGGKALRNVKEYDGAKLFDMWQEVAKLDKSKPAQAATFKALEDLIHGGAGEEVLLAFKAHQQTARNVANIDRVWSAGGGSGTGVGTGWLNPSHLKLEAGRGPKDAVTDAITEIVDLLNLRNPKGSLPAAEGVSGLAHSVGRATVGPIIEGWDSFMQKLGGPQAGKGARYTVDALRAAAKALPYTYQAGRE